MTVTIYIPSSDLEIRVIDISLKGDYNDLNNVLFYAYEGDNLAPIVDKQKLSEIADYLIEHHEQDLFMMWHERHEAKHERENYEDR